MVNRLKKLKFKSLPTVNFFINKIDDLKSIKDYNTFLSKDPKRTDFINFDSDGFELNDNIPIFKGWLVCTETSNEQIKVAKKDNCRIYFDTKDGVIVVNETNMVDNCTYNDLAIFFEGKLELN